jgi:hypothetical protein
MELNRFEEARGVIPTADVIEGRMVLLVTQGFDYDFGSKTDLAGARVPANTTEAKQARYLIGFAPDNRPTPIYQPMPAYTFALRAGGWDQTANTPFNAKVYLTQPGHQEGNTIPSGTPSVAYRNATVTLPSGSYIYSANIIVPGANVVVQDATTDSTAGEAGKLKYASFDADTSVGTVERYDTATKHLTVILN